jgi:microcystin-dependent protein
MPVPSTFDDLSETASANSPAGSESVGTQANEYFQVAFAFIKQLVDGKLKPTAAVNFNTQKATGLAAGDTTSTSTDAITGAQARGLAYKVGEQRMWHGAAANIATVWGPGWQVADGTNGTLDMRDRFPVGAGTSYGVGGTGGAATVALTTAQMPSHAHATSEAAHTHPIAQNPHGHAVSDPLHAHNLRDQAGNSAAVRTTNIGSGVQDVGIGSGSVTTSVNTAASATGISIQGALADVANGAVTTGLTIQANGGGAAHENRPPYMGLLFIEYTGIGA